MARHLSPNHRPTRSPAIPVAIAIVVVAAIAVGVAVFCGLVKPASDAGSASVASVGANATGESSGSSHTGENASGGDGKEAEDVNATGYASEVERLFAKGEVRSVRLIGDSITAGFGTDGYDEAVQTIDTDLIYSDQSGDARFETPASVNCWANAFRKYAKDHGVQKFVNAGINGAFMNRLADHAEEWLDGGADVVFVGLGTNDAGYYGPEEFRSTAQRGLAAAAQKCKVLVVLAPVRDLRPEYMLVEPASELGDVLKEICSSEGYLFVDPRDYVLPNMFNDDGLHPNSEGSLAIWECVRQTLGLE